MIINTDNLLYRHPKVYPFISSCYLICLSVRRVIVSHLLGTQLYKVSRWNCGVKNPFNFIPALCRQLQGHRNLNFIRLGLFL